MAVARADDGSTITLLEDSDNWANLQAFVDAHTAVQLPPGNFLLSRTLQIGNARKELTAPATDATTLKMVGNWKGPVVGIGGGGRWDGSAGYGQADHCIVRGMTLWQQHDVGTGTASANKKVLFNEAGDHQLFENLRIRGSSYEGLTSGNDRIDILIRNIEALDCGLGGDAYGLATSALNAASVDTVIEDFVCRGCGQGIETGNTRVTVRRGLVCEPGVTLGGTTFGVNIGNTGYGVYQVTVSGVVIDGFTNAIVTGNGNGRLCAVTITGCKIINGEITFQGGIATNSVHTPYEGPDTEGSYIRANTFNYSAPNNGAVTYNDGISDNGGILGREPLTIAQNEIYYALPDVSLQVAPTFGFAGEIGAPCSVYGNIIDGLPAAPARGDVQTFTLIDNPAIPGMPNLTVAANLATYHGRMRPFSVRIEA